MIGLCKSILEKNSIYNFTTVTDVAKEGEYYNIYTDRGNVKAKYVVLATHYPIVNMPGFHFLKMYQSTSYIIAIETENEIPQGMYINDKPPIYSFRTAMHNGKKVLVVVGGDHKTGETIENDNNYAMLEKKVKDLYPQSEILFRWNTEDCIGLDKIPYIGEFSTIMPNVYVGTGFKKWGITSSNVAANVITDKILGKYNKYSNIFNSKRIKPIKKKNLAEIAMSYGYVYVAQVAMGYDANQTVKAIKEAVAYNGPSLIIGYAPCINHGIKGGMSDTQKIMKNAVLSGYWHTFRYDPVLVAEGKNPFQMDSKEPSASYNDFIMNEVRYSSLVRKFPEKAEELFKAAEEQAKEKYNHLTKYGKLFE